MQSEDSDSGTESDTSSHPDEYLLNLLERNLYKFTFKESCDILESLDMDVHLNLIKSVILEYSLKIYGFPDCPIEDLHLAVYFFIEDVFGIVSKFELCVRYVKVSGKIDAVGVVLDSILTKFNILKKSKNLEGSGIMVAPNDDIGWILDGFCSNKTRI